MRRGCISLGQIKCDECGCLIPYPDRYLAIEETAGVTTRLCVDCALKKNYARYKVEKGEQVLTFFGD
ncbi:MAG: hypothetical protein Q8O05_04555 [Chloroflexota bacterium]|nr:hypothetical protein [Chloroflexota bacterium]